MLGMGYMAICAPGRIPRYRVSGPPQRGPNRVPKGSDLGSIWGPIWGPYRVPDPPYRGLQTRYPQIHRSGVSSDPGDMVR